MTQMDERDPRWNSAIRNEFSMLQFRQELHDIYYHSDVHNLALPDRLKHLILLQVKYAARVYSGIQEYRVDFAIASRHDATETDRKFHFRNIDRISSICVDAVIITISMMNACNKSVGDLHLFEDEIVHLDSIMRHVGIMSKTIEDVNRMGQTNPIETIFNSCVILLGTYVSLHRKCGKDIRELFSSVHRRLTAIEEESVFHSKYKRIIDQQLNGR